MIIMRTKFASVRFRHGHPVADPGGMPETPPLQPEWGRMIQEKRGHWSIRQAAQRSGLSDVFWAQMERGFKKTKGRYIPVHPSVGSLLQAAAALGMTERERNTLLRAAGHEQLPAPRRQLAIENGTVRRFVSTDGLTDGQEEQLEALAEFFRRQNPAAGPDS